MDFREALHEGVTAGVENILELYDMHAYFNCEKHVPALPSKAQALIFAKLMKLLSERFAAYGIITISALAILFQLLVMLGVFPANIVWGGRISSRSQLLVFESIAIGLNIVICAVVAIRIGLWKVRFNSAWLRAILWLLFGLLGLNTVGNLFSVNAFERAAFTPVTLLLALFFLRLAIGRKPTDSAPAAAQV